MIFTDFASFQMFFRYKSIIISFKFHFSTEKERRKTKLTKAILTALALLSLIIVDIKFCKAYWKWKSIENEQKMKRTLFNLIFLCFSFCFLISLIICVWIVTRKSRSWHCNKRRKNNSHKGIHSIKPRFRIRINARTIIFQRKMRIFILNWTWSYKSNVIIQNSWI